MSKRTVLIPLDGSDFSRQILPVVQQYLQPEKVSLILFQVAIPNLVTVESNVYASAMEDQVWTGAYAARTHRLDQQSLLPAQERETYRIQLQATLEQEARQLRQAGYEVTAEVHFGDAAERIIEYVTDMEIDMVAMATHGRTGLGRFVLGSVAEQTLRRLHVPVLLLRPPGANER
ncbi:MAG: universal stress protein [Caldilineaceae bacterium]|nr:universal stress protein [Caldilineaceae bacterium]